MTIRETIEKLVKARKQVLDIVYLTDSIGAVQTSNELLNIADRLKELETLQKWEEENETTK